MQFMTLALFALTSATTTLAAATGGAPGAPIPASQCNTGSVQCCDSTGKASDTSIAKILGLLGVVVQDVNAIVGVTCTPITVIGAGGDSW